ncbi:MAG: hypothetical protein ACO3GP_08615, partial [Candidatus Limnocylindrus sp.]
EIELREVSITPMPAVPGAEVAAARNEEVVEEVPEPLSERTDDELLLIAARVALDALPAEKRTALLETYAPTPTPTETASSAQAIVADTPTSTEGTRYVKMEDRVKAARSTFVLPK